MNVQGQGDGRIFDVDGQTGYYCNERLIKTESKSTEKLI